MSAKIIRDTTRAVNARVVELFMNAENHILASPSAFVPFGAFAEWLNNGGR